MKWSWHRAGVEVGRHRWRRVRWAAPLAVSVGLVACAAASNPSRPLSLPTSPGSGGGGTPDNARVMVKLRNPSVDRAAVAADAQAVAGVPVAVTGAVTPEWQALRLDCVDAGACDAAVTRLRADTGRYLLVEIDRRASTLPIPRDRTLAK